MSTHSRANFIGVLKLIMHNGDKTGYIQIIYFDNFLHKKCFVGNLNLNFIKLLITQYNQTQTLTIIGYYNYRKYFTVLELLVK